jgi:multidrug efflux pump subunit AcrA (membrane-fusion protein)
MSQRAGTPTFPPGRYGRRRDPTLKRRRRVITWALAGVVALAGVGIAYKLFNQYALAPYQVSDVATTAVTDTSVTVSFSVSLPNGGAATCTVRAQTRTGSLVGTAEVIVPPAPAGQASTRVTYTLHTSSRPFAATVPGCGPTS